MKKFAAYLVDVLRCIAMFGVIGLLLLAIDLLLPSYYTREELAANFRTLAIIAVPFSLVLPFVSKVTSKLFREGSREE